MVTRMTTDTDTDTDSMHGTPRLERVLDCGRETEMDAEERSRGEAQDCH